MVPRTWLLSVLLITASCSSSFSRLFHEQRNFVPAVIFRHLLYYVVWCQIIASPYPHSTSRTGRRYSRHSILQSLGIDSLSFLLFSSFIIVSSHPHSSSRTGRKYSKRNLLQSLDTDSPSCLLSPSFHSSIHSAMFGCNLILLVIP